MPREKRVTILVAILENFKFCFFYCLFLFASLSTICNVVFDVFVLFILKIGLKGSIEKIFSSNFTCLLQQHLCRENHTQKKNLPKASSNGFGGLAL